MTQMQSVAFRAMASTTGVWGTLLEQTGGAGRPIRASGRTVLRRSQNDFGWFILPTGRVRRSTPLVDQ